MRRSFLALLADKYIQLTHRISEKKVKKALLDYRTNKNNYKIPNNLKFPRNISCNLYGDMKVFEMLPESENLKTIMFIHGGGYIQNFLVYHWKFLIKLSKKRGYGLTAPNYPLLPKYTHKKSHEKVIAYYREYASKHDMKNVVLMGDSAGGGFCLALLLELKELNLPLPGKVILISPFVDVTKYSTELAKEDSLVDYKAATLLGKRWADGTDLKDPRISPLYGDLTNLPPINIYVGTYEVLYSQCIEVYDKLKESGNETNIYIGEKMEHDFPIYPIPEGKTARKNMIEFIEK